MNKKVNIKTFIIVASLIMLFLMGTISLAGGSYSAVATLTSNSDVEIGDTIIVNVNLSNIVAGEGIDTISAKLEYDTDVFEEIKTSDFISDSNWKVTYASSTNRLTALKNLKTTSNERIFSIKLKARNTISNAKTQVKLTDIVVSGGAISIGGTGDISVKDAVRTIKITRPIYSASMKLTSESKLRIGEIIKVKATISNIVAGDGIDTICANLSYDKNVFEQLLPKDINSDNNWNVTYSPSTDRLTAIKSSKVKSTETVFTIDLKVKSLDNVETTAVTLSDIEASGGAISIGGTGDIELSNATTIVNKMVTDASNMPITIDNTIKAMNVDSTEEIKKDNKIIEKISEKAEVINAINVEDTYTEMIDDLEKLEKIAKVDTKKENKEIIKSDMEQMESYEMKEEEKTVSPVATVTTVASVSSLGYCIFELIRKLLLGV